MEQYPQYQVAPFLQDRRLQIIGGVVLVCLCILLLFLTFAGYGTVRFSPMPGNPTIRLNGHVVAANSLKLRPGDYQVLITSPSIMTYEGTLHISMLRSTTYSPAIIPKNPDAVASSVLGSVPGTQLAPVFSDHRWFDNNTWLAGVFTPSDTIVAIHYDSTQKKWVLVMSDANGYPNDTTSLPAAVASYVQTLVIKKAQPNDA